MSTERPENDVTGPRRRRSPLAVASVAAAVLLTGGGAAYWASTASGDGGTDSRPGGVRGQRPSAAGTGPRGQPVGSPGHRAG